MVRLTDRPDMTLDVYRGRKTTMQQKKAQEQHYESWRKRTGTTIKSSDDAKLRYLFPQKSYTAL